MSKNIKMRHVDTHVVIGGIKPSDVAAWKKAGYAPFDSTNDLNLQLAEAKALNAELQAENALLLAGAESGTDADASDMANELAAAYDQVTKVTEEKNAAAAAVKDLEAKLALLSPPATKQTK